MIQSLFITTSSQGIADKDQIAIEWQNSKPVGFIEVLNGKLEQISISEGKGKINNDHFAFRSADFNRLEISFSDVRLNYGSGTTVVSVHSGDKSFSFFLRDVKGDFPIYIPEYNVIVCRSDDKRSYTEIENAIRGRSLQTNLQKTEDEPEESFDSASVYTRNQTCPTWLGISRDIRIFEISTPQEMDMIVPRMASSSMSLPESNSTNVTYGYMAGRGQGVENNRVKKA